MIITGIQLSPFAGLNNLDLNFSQGLNVILGPNEAGKSTIFNALDNVLFTNADLTPAKFRDYIEDYLPVGGGDTVQVKLRFKHKNKKYTLKRRWGPNPDAELTLPDGNIVTDESAIDEQLEGYLGATEGTCQSVLMTNQSALANTLNSLEEDNPDTVMDLGDILRTSLLETDGVSVGEFTGQLDKKYHDYFARWDVLNNCPEQGRGIEHPWKKDLGHILKAFYRKEEARAAYEEAVSVEEEIDLINQQISELSKTVSKKQSYITDNRKAVEDAKEREICNAQIAKIVNDIDEYKNVIKKWPLIEKNLTDIENALPELEKKVEKLEQQKAQAEKIEKNRQIAEKYQRVLEKKSQVQAADKNLKSVPKLSTDNFNKIRSSKEKIDRLHAKLAAGKLAVKFTAKNQITLGITKDVEDAHDDQIKKGDIKKYEAGARLRIEHDDWILEVTSGEGELAGLVKELESSKKELNSLLNKYRLKSIEQAKIISKRYEECFQALKNAKDNFQAELGDTTPKELVAKMKELKKIKPTKPLAEIVEAFVSTENQLKNKKSEKIELAGKNQNLIDKYSDQDSLLDKLTEAKQKAKELKQMEEKLVPLPEGVIEVEAFIGAFKQKEETLRDELEGQKELEIRRAEIKAPDQSSEELYTHLNEMNEHFETVKRKGQAISRVRNVAATLSESLYANTYEGLEKEVADYVKAMTDGRYKKIAMDDSLPSGFVREDGMVIEAGMLSTGTLDVLGLALRLAMANHFLRGNDGFIVMDDPLVDLDPERQSKAAGLLKKYSNTKQILLFTCHPSHAGVLDGQQITLS